jgi:hypothetical protein
MYFIIFKIHTVGLHDYEDALILSVSYVKFEVLNLKCINVGNTKQVNTKSDVI